MKECKHYSKMQMGPQRMVAGGRTSKSGGSTSKTMYAILPSSLTQKIKRNETQRLRVSPTKTVK